MNGVAFSAKYMVAYMSLTLQHNTMGANAAAKASTEQLQWASDGCQTMKAA